MLNLIVWLVIGGIIGWLASMLMNHPEGRIMNIIVGIVGAFVGGLLVGPLFHTSTINQNNFSVLGLLVSFIGAVILLAIVNVIRRGSMR